MFKEIFNKLFIPSDTFPDGARVFHGHRECVCYEHNKRKFIEFDIEFDNGLFVVIQEPLFWEGELSGKIEEADVDKIKHRIGLYFQKRGMKVQLR